MTILNDFEIFNSVISLVLENSIKYTPEKGKIEIFII